MSPPIVLVGQPDLVTTQQARPHELNLVGRENQLASIPFAKLLQERGNEVLCQLRAHGILQLVHHEDVPGILVAQLEKNRKQIHETLRPI